MVMQEMCSSTYSIVAERVYNMFNGINRKKKFFKSSYITRPGSFGGVWDGFPNALSAGSSVYFSLI